MPTNFSANQYELTFKPRALQNWEVPKFRCSRPHARTGITLIVANTRGHLLPGVHKSSKSPWGDFQGIVIKSRV